MPRIRKRIFFFVMFYIAKSFRLSMKVRLDMSVVYLLTMHVTKKNIKKFNPAVHELIARENGLNVTSA